ncbi:MAG TPA: Xaa-Pro peptidase family protein [Solirubrobacteraceae bacterium]|nr:Xaa-Pro peptidase family protein [Solirubrobacteraceae bacterium]
MSSAVSAGVTGRAGRLAAGLRERDVDVLLVGTPVNVRYLTGFTGTNGLALVVAGQAETHRFFTDFRYATQSAAQVPEEFDREIVAGDLLEAAAGALCAAGSAAGGRLGFDEASITVKQHTRLGELLGGEWELVPCAGAVERLRAVKDAWEIDRIRASAELADEALRGVLEEGVVRRTERDVAIELELRMRRLGAQAPSFPSIVAAGSQGALPHAEPRAREIRKDALLTIDWGALHEGYCSDCTRTYATGERISARARETYELVLAAQEQALAAVRAGPNGKEVDAVARELIEAAGEGDHFGHGLGHGVGLEVHEGPRLSRLASEDPLLVGNVVTVEPGVYLPGRLGVRIEDLVVITKDGQEVLSRLGKELTVVS